MRITDGAPDPERVRNAAEFAERLQELKYWSALTYRELTARAEAMGEVLPRSTVANMLSRDTLPREELVSVFVRACGCGPAVAEVWLRVRKELAAGGGVRRPEGPGAEEEPPDAADGTSGADGTPGAV
ncbi:XRE family transcriptional regulator, partial [Streptomyces sp. GC420]|nr:XRE family transcriptional regulator [Streptomyces sp. GC420]